MTSRAHIIGKQVFDVEIDIGEDFFALQQEISRVFQTRVAPALDTLFSGYVGDDAVLRLDRLEVDVGRIDRAHLEDELAARIVEALEPVLTAQLGDNLMTRALSGAPYAAQRPTGEEGSDEREVAAQGGVDEGVAGRQTMAGHTIELWHFFLQHGHFPWWAPVQEPSAFEARVIEALEAQPALLRQTRVVVRQTPVALQRLALQFSDAFLDRLVRVSAPSLSLRLLRIAQDVSQGVAVYPAWGIRPRVFRQVFWQEALRGIFIDGFEQAVQAERAVLRRALQHISRRLAVRYPDLLGRIQATLRDAEPGFIAPSAERLRGLVGALMSAADPTGEGTTSEVERVDPPRAVEEEDVQKPQPPGASTEAEEQQHRPAKHHSDAVEAFEQHDGSAGEISATEAAQDLALPGDAAQQHTLPEAEQDKDTAPLTPSGAERATEEAAAVHGKKPDGERRRPEPLKEGTELYLHNAGLVLLHPYLKAHFEHLGLLEEKGFVDEDARQRAIYQLQYLATGDEEAMEYSLTLNKLLCGYSLEQPLARDVVLGDAERAEAEDLLKAVIRNWPALKNTSPDGLREGFLQRDGKLTRKPFNWLLQVEQKSHDILLGHLPWGIGLIKLSWMPEMLNVEWA